MDLKELSNLGNAKVHVNDTSVEDTQLKKLNKLPRIYDSAIPNKADERKQWIENHKKRISDAICHTAEEIKFISDSIDRIYSQMNLRNQKVLDQNGLLNAEKKRLQDSLTSLKLKLETTLSRLSDTAQKLRSSESKCSSVESSYEQALKEKNRLTDSVSELLTKLTKLEQFRSKIFDDSEYVLETKEENDRKNEETRKQIEELQKQIEENKKNDEQRTVIVKDDYTEDTTSRFSESIENFLQNGSVYEAKKAQAIAEEIGDQDLIELMNRAVNYEPLDETTYEDLTHRLKENLEKYHQVIPSLPLLRASDSIQKLKDCSTLPADSTVIQQVLQNIYNSLSECSNNLQYTINSALEVLGGWTPAAQLLENPTMETFQGCLNSVNACSDTPVVVTEQAPMSVLPVEACCDPLLTKSISRDEYLSLYDSASKFNALKRIVLRLKDDDSLKCSARSSDCGNYVLVTCHGIEKYYVPVDGVTVEEAVDFINSEDGDLSKVVSVDRIKEIAAELDELPVASDSILYKRCLSDKCFVTDSFTADEARNMVKTLVPVIGVKTATQVLENLGKAAKYRIAVSDNKDGFPNPKDFTSMKASEALDYISDNKRYNIRLFF